MRKKSRLFALAEALRARRTGVTAQELADRFGVTLRTIYRDLEALQDAGMPIRADRGRGGGYALDKTYQLPPVNFTAREAALLVALARLATEQRLIPFPAAIERAVDKVKAALSTSAQRELLQLVGELQLVGVPARPVPLTIQTAVETAWFEARSASSTPRPTATPARAWSGSATPSSTTRRPCSTASISRPATTASSGSAPAAPPI